MEDIKKVKYLLTLICVSVCIEVNANESNNYSYLGDKIYGGYVDYLHAALFNIQDEYGKKHTVYCMDFNYLIEEGHNYSLMNVSDAEFIITEKAVKLRNIVSNAYPYVTIEEVRSISGIEDLTIDEAIAGAQAAIWYLVNGYNFRMEENVRKLHDFYVGISNVSGNPTDISEIGINYNIYFEEGVRYLKVEASGKNLYNLSLK